MFLSAQIVALCAYTQRMRLRGGLVRRIDVMPHRPGDPVSCSAATLSTGGARLALSGLAAVGSSFRNPVQALSHRPSPTSSHRPSSTANFFSTILHTLMTTPADDAIVGEIKIDPPSPSLGWNNLHSRCMDSCIPETTQRRDGNLICPFPGCKTTQPFRKDLHRHFHQDHPRCHVCSPGTPNSRMSDPTTLEKHYETVHKYSVCVFYECKTPVWTSQDARADHYEHKHPNGCCIRYVITVCCSVLARGYSQ